VLTDGVVVGQTFVRAECLALNGFESALVDVTSIHIPARREARFIQHDGSMSICDYAVGVADHEMA
jgi:hypothetical protein